MVRALMNLSTKFVLLILALGLGTVAHSAPMTCVQKATDDELIGEIQARLGSSTGEVIQVSVYATCNGPDLSVSSTRIDKGMTFGKEIATDSTRTCAYYADVINKKAAVLSKGGLAATCNGSEMTIVTIARTGEVSLNSKSTDSSLSCSNQAQVINSK